MNEQELKNLIVVYQQKLNETISQNIALEARLLNGNQKIEALNQKIIELEQKKTVRTNKKSEEFNWNK